MPATPTPDPAEGWIIDAAQGVPEAERAPVLLLAHGAGRGSDSPFLQRMAELLAARGITVARFDFGYMLRARAEGRRIAPPRAERLVDEYRARVAHWRTRGVIPFIGGKSLGGRVASLLADELFAQGDVRGLVCLGYPFHPPGRPQSLRTEHLCGLRTPALICQGDRDPFGTRGEVETYALSSAIRLCWLPDGDHDFKPRVKSGETWAGNLQMAAQCTASFVHEVQR